jgi:hypothetical protein
MTISQSEMPKKLSRGMRLILLGDSILVVAAGVDLTFFTEQTATYFAWTIQIPITAAFLGAGYLSSFLLEFLAYREKTWVKARIAIPSVLIFTIITLMITILHLDKFHLNSHIVVVEDKTEEEKTKGYLLLVRQLAWSVMTFVTHC